MKAPTISDVRDAAKRIDNHVTRTPLRLSHHLSEIAGQEVRLKMETMQDTGAFKLRGATNALLNLPEDLRGRGVVTMSSGNHGRGLAFASKKLGIPCTVYMSELVPSVKVEAIRALGADVVIAGPSQETAEVAVLEHVECDGVTYVHAFDQPDIIAGQGTLGLEILEDMPDTASVLIPLSGGGLFAGVLQCPPILLHSSCDDDLGVIFQPCRGVLQCSPILLHCGHDDVLVILQICRGVFQCPSILSH